jgi:CHASE3 domain sensor protein
MWKNVRIRTRMFIGFGILLVLFVITGWLSLREIRYVAGLTTELYEHPLTVGNAVREVNTHIIKIQRGLRDAALSENDAQLDAVIREVSENEQAVYD